VQVIDPPAPCQCSLIVTDTIFRFDTLSKGHNLSGIMAPPLSTSSGLSLLPVDCFAVLARQRGSIWLDSSLQRHDWGRTSIIATSPVAELMYQGGQGVIAPVHEPKKYCGLDEIINELESIRTDNHRWAVGYISYEAAFPWLSLKPSSDIDRPEIHFFVYDRIVEYDNQTGGFSDPDLAIRFMEEGYAAGTFRESAKVSATHLSPTLSKDDYLVRVERIKWHIREGDIYQANFTCRFDGRCGLDPFAAYLRLRRLNPCFYGAYLNFGDYQVLSSSPERLFLWRDDRLTSSPIKGTIARGSTPEETEHNLNALLHSEKDRAELLMIVDLVRNDLGRFARTGSVHVDNLYRTESLSSVIHLVADISARTRTGCTLNDVFKSMLPGGSITGAPKRRAVEILRELEATPRGVYTGAIGYVGGGRAEFNVAIRTMIHQNGSYHIHAGGGIVADSRPEAEYEEMLLKAHNLMVSIGAIE
jgi:para-aminobenzoate synthetase component 1